MANRLKFSRDLQYRVYNIVVQLDDVLDKTKGSSRERDSAVVDERRPHCLSEKKITRTFL